MTVEIELIVLLAGSLPRNVADRMQDRTAVALLDRLVLGAQRVAELVDIVLQVVLIARLALEQPHVDHAAECGFYRV